MSRYAEGVYDIYEESFPRARKNHTCAACRQSILQGHWYARIFILYAGRKRSLKRCLRCQYLHKHLRTKGYNPCDWPDERLNCGHIYENPPLEIQRLAFMTAGEAQRYLRPEATYKIKIFRWLARNWYRRNGDQGNFA